MSEREFVSVFRSGKSADTYIYLKRGFKWDDLPEGLRGIFGKPVHTLDLVLTPERKLARTTGREVLAAISEKDYFLQMPREQDSYIVEFHRTLEQNSR